MGKSAPSTTPMRPMTLPSACVCSVGVTVSVTGALSRKTVMASALPAFFWISATIAPAEGRSEEHTSELQSLMRISYAVFCLKTKNTTTADTTMNYENYREMTTEAST